MALGENLQYIRGKFGLTQEQFAEKLEVSRQSVSKWESGASFPEMDKILQICELYGVGVDDLIRGDVRSGFAADNTNYDEHMNSFSRGIAGGVALVIFGVSLMLFLISAGISDTVGTVVMFLFIIAAVPIFIISGIRHGEFCKKHPYIENFYSRQQIDAYGRKFPLFIAIPVAVILMGVVLLIASEELTVIWGWNEELFTAVFMLLVALAVPVIVYGSIQKSKYDIEEYNRENYYDPDYSKPDAVPAELREEYEKHAKSHSLTGRISGAIMLLATAVFLVMGLGWKMWHIAWVVYPVGGVLCGVVSVLIGDEK